MPADYNLTVHEAAVALGNPSAHLLAVAGLGLSSAQPPVVSVEKVRETAVVVSRSRRLTDEVYLERCRADGVPVLIRPSGGGAVVLCPGVVTASVLAPRPPDEIFPEPAFRRFVGAVSEALSACGVGPTLVRGISDLCIGERKIAGSSLRLWADRLLFQVALLVSADVALLERYLPMPSRMPDYRRNRGHREFVVTLAEAGFAASPATVCREMARALEAVAAL